MSERGPGEPRTHTHTLKGLSSRLGRRPALCPGCWVLQRDGVLLHCMRPRLHLGSDWACKITATPSANPLLPEGFSLHILPADYHHCQSWLLHSSCCPHSGSGANLTRLHGGRKLSHTAWRSRAAAQQSSSQALACCPLQKPTSSCCCCCSLLKEQHCKHYTPFRLSPSGAFVHYAELQTIRARSPSSLCGSSSSVQNRQRRFPCRPACVALCRCFLWAKSGQSAAFTVQKVTQQSSSM